MDADKFPDLLQFVAAYLNEGNARKGSAPVAKEYVGHYGPDAGIRVADQIDALLSQALSEAELENTLSKMGLEIEYRGNSAPTWRATLSRMQRELRDVSG
jgi:hypothetical protein